MPKVNTKSLKLAVKMAGEQCVADKKLMIFEAPKHTKTNFFRGSAPDPAGGVYSDLSESLAGGEELATPPQEPHPCLGPFGLDASALWTLLERAPPLLIHTT